MWNGEIWGFVVLYWSQEEARHCSCCRTRTSSNLSWTSQAMRSSDGWKNTRWKPWMTLMKLSLVRVLLRFWPLLTFPPGNCVSGQIWIWTSASPIITLFSFCFLYCHQRGQTVSPCAMRPHSCLSPDIHTFDSDCQQGLWPGGIWAW